MNVEALALRIYTHRNGTPAGFTAADFCPDEMLAGVTIVEPVRPPGLVGGIYTDAANIPGNACLVYRVLATASVQPDVGAIVLNPGDIVIVRTAHLDPLQPDLNVLAIQTKHIIARIT